MGIKSCFVACDPIFADPFLAMMKATLEDNLRMSSIGTNVVYWTL